MIHEGSIPFTRSIIYQWLTITCKQSASKSSTQALLCRYMHCDFILRVTDIVRGAVRSNLRTILSVDTCAFSRAKRRIFSLGFSLVFSLVLQGAFALCEGTKICRWRQVDTVLHSISLGSASALSSALSFASSSACANTGCTPYTGRYRSTRKRHGRGYTGLSLDFLATIESS